jgi:hypothetical protein
MYWMRLLVVALALGLIVPMALAQGAERGERRTETEPSRPGAEDAKDADQAKGDRGDERAERLLKRAYTRVHSAEADGLKRLHAGADIEVDASAFGMGAMPFPGEMVWKSGAKAEWRSTDEEEGGANPLGQLSDAVRELFEPYLAYVAGFEAWDVRFKEASFKMLEPEERGEGEEKFSVDRVEVTYGDKRVEQFSVARNQVLDFTRDATVQGQEAKLTFGFEYEDQGRKLRPKRVTGTTEIAMPDMPEDPRNPVPGGSQRETLEGSIEVKRWGKAGEYDIAIELEGKISLSSMGINFPAKLKITNAKVNDDVKDDVFGGGSGGSDSEGDRDRLPDEEDF